MCGKTCYDMGMSEAHSKASRARMKAIPKAELSRRMSALASRRHAALSKRQRRANAMKMVRARKGYHPSLDIEPQEE